MTGGQTANFYLPGATLSADHNLLWANVRSYSGVNPGPGDVALNPRFVNAAIGDYHLRLGSPAMNAGSPVGAPLADKDGLLRPQMGGFDIGAYELAGQQTFLPLATKPGPPPPPCLAGTSEGLGCE